MIELLEGAGYSRTDDAKLFEYAEFWLNNNQFAPWSDAEKFEKFQDTYGFKQYLEHGDVLIEEE